MTWLPYEIATLKRLWPLYEGSCTKIAKIMGKTKGMIDGKSRVLGLQYPHGGSARTLKKGAWADHYAKSVFQQRVKAVRPQDEALKSGLNQRKIGGKVRKGAWKGFPIVCLTLEERATCSRMCGHWLDCYGNNMGHAIRFRHDDALLDKIASEVSALQAKHPRGFAVRLHVLGDFYSTEYVGFWELLMARCPALNVFGYTHWQVGTQIGDEVARLRARFGDRFSVRHSDAVTGYRAITIEKVEDRGDAIVCPAQTTGSRGRTCSTCALCWSTDKPIAFLKH